ncbi:2-oxoglutarate and iron-dependent oxygenase domain-containing protein 3 [Nilaparvata lugens]|uniref:2-oxoglutarate and iron-dependent oxygenase domain-containing protein 3 n=1 Tax=Nilaparvata lugens TaxID=108931 RepID=UPI00193E782A|nr:2-oxoglutarate and iron-dependent oxygenase domain-containing protein 3 [Nilaparvata lugens]
MPRKQLRKDGDSKIGSRKKIAKLSPSDNRKDESKSKNNSNTSFNFKLQLKIFCFNCVICLAASIYLYPYYFYLRERHLAKHTDHVNLQRVDVPCSEKYRTEIEAFPALSNFKIYKQVRGKIQSAIAQHFGIDEKVLHLTHPTFFSRLTSIPPSTPHDEYWHPHVDKETYESFHYTSLLYLNNFGDDYTGGRFVFIDPDNSTLIVEPKKGRVSMFTSGWENVHLVERVSSGTRYALTISFTCDESHAIKDPS